MKLIIELITKLMIKLMTKLIIKIKKIFNAQFIKFAVVGALGTITNLSIFYIFVDKAKFNPTLISSIAFLVAVTQNYLLNHFWTFKNIVKEEKPSFKSYFKFVVTSLTGLAVNLSILNVLLYFFVFKYKVFAQAAGIFAGFLINYIGSKFFVFKSKNFKSIN